LADLVGPTLDHHVLVDAAGRRGWESAAAKDGLLSLIEQVPHKDGLELLGHIAGLVRRSGPRRLETRVG
jgi:hypothetical protein